MQARRRVWWTVLMLVALGLVVPAVLWARSARRRRAGGRAVQVQPTRCVSGRTTVDRPDDVGGYQVRVNYVLARDGVDRGLDTNGTLVTAVRAWTNWFASQSEGLRIRMDTCEQGLDIRFVRLKRTQDELRSRGAFIRDAIEQDMQEQGLLQPSKLEAVYYDGPANETCGNGPWPPKLVGHVVAMYLQGTFSSPNVPPCASNPLGASETQPGYLEFAMLHEVFHGLGAAPECAPHHTRAGHTSDDPTDLMYAGDQPWRPSVLDVGRDDYFRAGIPGCVDVSRSVFLEPLPANAQRPPGW